MQMSLIDYLQFFMVQFLIDLPKMFMAYSIGVCAEFHLYFADLEAEACNPFLSQVGYLK